MLVDILTEDGILLARVLNRTETEYLVQYFLKKTGSEFVYEDTIETVDAECINAQYEDDEVEQSEGYDRYINGDDASEYEPSVEDDSDSESLVSEDDDE